MKKRKIPHHKRIEKSVFIKQNIRLECHTATPKWFVDCAPEIYRSMVLNKDMGLRAASIAIFKHSERLVDLIRSGYEMTCQCKDGDFFKGHKNVLSVIKCETCEVHEEIVSPAFVKQFPNGKKIEFDATVNRFRKVFILKTGHYEKI